MPRNAAQEALATHVALLSSKSAPHGAKAFTFGATTLRQLDKHDESELEALVDSLEERQQLCGHVRNFTCYNGRDQVFRCYVDVDSECDDEQLASVIRALSAQLPVSRWSYAVTRPAFDETLAYTQQELQWLNVQRKRAHIHVLDVAFESGEMVRCLLNAVRCALPEVEIDCGTPVHQSLVYGSVKAFGSNAKLRLRASLHYQLQQFGQVCKSSDSPGSIRDFGHERPKYLRSNVQALSLRRQLCPENETLVSSSVPALPTQSRKRKIEATNNDENNLQECKNEGEKDFFEQLIEQSLARPLSTRVQQRGARNRSRRIVSVVTNERGAEYLQCALHVDEVLTLADKRESWRRMMRAFCCSGIMLDSESHMKQLCAAWSCRARTYFAQRLEKRKLLLNAKSNNEFALAAFSQKLLLEHIVKQVSDENEREWNKFSDAKAVEYVEQGAKVFAARNESLGAVIADTLREKILDEWSERTVRETLFEQMLQGASSSERICRVVAKLIARELGERLVLTSSWKHAQLQVLLIYNKHHDVGYWSEWECESGGRSSAGGSSSTNNAGNTTLNAHIESAKRKIYAYAFVQMAQSLFSSTAFVGNDSTRHCAFEQHYALWKDLETQSVSACTQQRRVLGALRSLCQFRARGTIDARRQRLMVFANGLTLDMNSVPEIRAHQPGDMNFSFNENRLFATRELLEAQHSAAEVARVESMLKCVMQERKCPASTEKYEFVLELLAGGIVRGNPNRYILLLTGRGANGKTWVMQLLQCAFRSRNNLFNVQVSSSSLCQFGQSDSQTCNMFDNCLGEECWLMCDELDLNSVLNGSEATAGLVKQLTGNSVITFRPVYARLAQQQRITGKLIANTNRERPTFLVVPSNVALLDRLMLVPCEQTFSSVEREGTQRQDPTLLDPDTLQRHGEILINLLVQRVLASSQRNVKIPTSVYRFNFMVRFSNCPFTQFAFKVLRHKRGATCNLSKLRAQYVSYLESPVLSSRGHRKSHLELWDDRRKENNNLRRGSSARYSSGSSLLEELANKEHLCDMLSRLICVEEFRGCSLRETVAGETEICHAELVETDLFSL